MSIPHPLPSNAEVQTGVPPLSADQKPALGRNLVLPHAQRLCDLLRPVCERVEIAGSLRREKDIVSDVEVIALPRPREMPDLFGGEVSGAYAFCDEFDTLLRDLLGQGLIALDTVTPRNGRRQKRFVLPSLCGPGYECGFGCDLFLADPDNWGNTLAIRTGCREFSKFLVNRAWYRMERRQRNGYLWQCKRGDFATGDVPIGRPRVSCPTEISYFQAVGVPYIEPPQRNEAAIERIRRAGL